MFAKVISLFAVFVATASAATIGGERDILGNYYDYTTGQYSSALTGNVYNTALAPVARLAYATPIAPVVVSPYYYGLPYGAAYVSPLLRR